MIQYPGMGTKKKDAAEETKTAQDVSDWVDQAIDIKNLIHSLHKKIDIVTEGLDKYLRKQLN